MRDHAIPLPRVGPTWRANSDKVTAALERLVVLYPGERQFSKAAVARAAALSVEAVAIVGRNIQDPRWTCHRGWFTPRQPGASS